MALHVAQPVDDTSCRFVCIADERIATESEPLRLGELELGERVLPTLKASQPDCSTDRDRAQRAGRGQTSDSCGEGVGSAA
jgi:hypothetical protein